MSGKLSPLHRIQAMAGIAAMLGDDLGYKRSRGKAAPSKMSSKKWRKRKNRIKMAKASRRRNI